MENEFIQGMPDNPILTFLVSILLSMIVAISGVLPSAFITGVNIAVFGFKAGLIVSIIGEAAGAVVSFLLYRQGVKKLDRPLKSRLLKKLKDTGGLEAASLVILLRIVPFIPSGAVTLTAAFSKMGLLSFSVVSTLGKIPSLFIEAYSVKWTLGLTANWQLIILFFIVLGLVFYGVLKRKRH